MTGLSGSESDDLGVSTDSGERPWSLSPASGAWPGGDGATPAAAAGPDGEDADIRAYGKTLGVDVDRDADLLWVVHEAFVASLPPSWTEYYDEDGRVYFHNQVTQESSWSHPMDNVFKEIIQVVKALKAEQPAATKARKSEVVQAHLQSVHERAMAQLDGWSGPYTSDTGAYYYNAALQVSVWDNPVDEWQSELSLRQQVLHRCLLAESPAAPGAGAAGDGLEGGGLCLTEAALHQLPLGLNARSPDDNAPVPQSPGSARSARSFLSARSTCTARSLTPTRVRLREFPRPSLDRTTSTGSASATASGARSPQASPARQRPTAAGAAAPGPAAKEPGASTASSRELPSEACCCSPLDELAQSEEPQVNASVSMMSNSVKAPELEGQESAAAVAEAAPPPPAGQQPAAARSSSSSGLPPPLPAAPDRPSPAAAAPARQAAEDRPAAASSERQATEDRPTAASSARQAAEETDEEDTLEFTFGRTAPVSLPQFGT